MGAWHSRPSPEGVVRPRPRRRCVLKLLGACLERVFCFWRRRSSRNQRLLDHSSAERKRLFLCFWRGYRPKSPTIDPRNDMHRAASTGDRETVRQLLALQKYDVNYRDEDNRTALHFACFYGQQELVTLLMENNCEIDCLDNENTTPLMKAAQSGQEEIVNCLLEHGADPNIKDVSGNTALHHAVYFGTPAVVTNLLTHGANIEQETQDGFTPLLLALRQYKLKIVKLLINMGANVHVCDHFRRNALTYAVRCDSEDIVKLLLQRNVDFYSEDYYGWIALKYALEGECKVLRILLDYEYNLSKSLQTKSPACDTSEDEPLPSSLSRLAPWAVSLTSAVDVYSSDSQDIIESLPQSYEEQRVCAEPSLGKEDTTEVKNCVPTNEVSSINIQPKKPEAELEVISLEDETYSESENIQLPAAGGEISSTVLASSGSCELNLPAKGVLASLLVREVAFVDGGDS